MNLQSRRALMLMLVWLGPSPSIADIKDDQLKAARAEIKELKAQLSARNAKPTKKARTDSPSAAGSTPLNLSSASKPVQTIAPWYGTVLLRKDNLEASDILFPGTLPRTTDAKGANFNWTNNYIQKTNNITTQTYLSWIPPLFLHDSSPNYYNPNVPTVLNSIIAPFTYLNGSLTNPYNSKTEKSAAQFGLNGELALLIPPPITETVFSFLPYYQTDFRGYASIAGFEAQLEPYDHDLHLGSAVTTESPQVFDWYWRVIGVANPIWVDNAGLTSFESHTTYGLVGAIGQLRGTLFANTPSVGTALCGRISVLGSFQPMWDATDYKTDTLIHGHNYVNVVHGGYVNNVHAEVDYDLAPKPSKVTEHCGGAVIDPQDKTPKTFWDSQTFDASLSLTYDSGVDFSTYQKANKFMLGLTLLY
jgi:hypothetical protein